MRYNTENIINMVSTAFDNLSSELLIDNMKYLSDIEFFNEFRILKLKLPRRSGHTTAALQLLGNYPKSILIPAFNTHISHTLQIEHRNKIIPLRVINEYFMRGKYPLDLVIVDNSSYLTTKELNTLYSAFNSMSNTKLFIELG